jgi:hypothetical protein
MNDPALKQFDFRGASVRTVMIKGEPWWVAADVCAVLEINNSPDAIRRLEKEDVALTDTLRSNGRPYKMQIINEPGLYELIIRSDKAQFYLKSTMASFRFEGLCSRFSLAGSITNIHPEIAARNGTIFLMPGSGGTKAQNFSAFALMVAR